MRGIANNRAVGYKKLAPGQQTNQFPFYAPADNIVEYYLNQRSSKYLSRNENSNPTVSIITGRGKAL